MNVLLAVTLASLVVVNSASDDVLAKFNKDLANFEKEVGLFGENMAKWSSNVVNQMQQLPKNTVISNGIHINLSTCSQVCAPGIFKCKVTKFTSDDRRKIITETLCYDPATDVPEKKVSEEPNKYGSSKVYATSSLNG